MGQKGPLMLNNTPRAMLWRSIHPATHRYRNILQLKNIINYYHTWHPLIKLKRVDLRMNYWLPLGRRRNALPIRDALILPAKLPPASTNNIIVINNQLTSLHNSVQFKIQRKYNKIIKRARINKTLKMFNKLFNKLILLFLVIISTTLAHQEIYLWLPIHDSVCSFAMQNPPIKQMPAPLYAYVIQNPEQLFDIASQRILRNIYTNKIWNPTLLLYSEISIKTMSVYIWNTLLPGRLNIPSLATTTTIIVEAPRRDQYDANAIIILWSQIMSIAILTIWARGVGPRFRPDQISDVTWKDLLLFLISVLVIAVLFMR